MLDFQTPSEISNMTTIENGERQEMVAVVLPARYPSCTARFIRQASTVVDSSLLTALLVTHCCAATEPLYNPSYRSLPFR